MLTKEIRQEWQGYLRDGYLKTEHIQLLAKKGLTEEDYIKLTVRESIKTYIDLNRVVILIRYLGWVNILGEMDVTGISPFQSELLVGWLVEEVETPTIKGQTLTIGDVLGVVESILDVYTDKVKTGAIGEGIYGQVFSVLQVLHVLSDYELTQTTRDKLTDYFGGVRQELVKHKNEGLPEGFTLKLQGLMEKHKDEGVRKECGALLLWVTGERIWERFW